MNKEEGIQKMRELEKTCLNWDKSKIAIDEIHPELDKILLEFVPPAIRDEYKRIEDKVGGFWYA